MWRPVVIPQCQQFCIAGNSVWNTKGAVWFFTNCTVTAVLTRLLHCVGDGLLKLVLAMNAFKLGFFVARLAH
jgi:hypothetical protein